MLFPILAIIHFFKVQSADLPDEKLIRVNEWQDITIDGSTHEDALVDFHLFATCEKFSVLFATEQDESTRFGFSFDDATLRKIDVESVGRDVDIPNTPKLIGTCREKNRKILRMKVRTSNETIVFKIDDQLIRRPYDPSQKKVRILIPQSVPCCLIRGLFLSNQDLEAYSSTSSKYQTFLLGRQTESVDSRKRGSFSRTSSSSPAPTLLVETTTPSEVLNETNTWSKFTLGKNPTISSTSKPKQESSWTHAVNKEWSITFVLCSIVICAIMLFLAVFGTFTVFYLMTKPQDGKSPFAVDA